MSSWRIISLKTASGYADWGAQAPKDNGAKFWRQARPRGIHATANSQQCSASKTRAQFPTGAAAAAGSRPTILHALWHDCGINWRTGCWYPRAQGQRLCPVAAPSSTGLVPELSGSPAPAAPSLRARRLVLTSEWLRPPLAALANAGYCCQPRIRQSPVSASPAYCPRSCLSGNHPIVDGLLPTSN